MVRHVFLPGAVIAIQDDMNWGEGNQDNLYWGTDINFDKADVDDATRSLFIRYDEQGGDFSEEIAIYKRRLRLNRADWRITRRRKLRR